MSDQKRIAQGVATWASRAHLGVVLLLAALAGECARVWVASGTQRYIDVTVQQASCWLYAPRSIVILRSLALSGAGAAHNCHLESPSYSACAFFSVLLSAHYVDGRWDTTCWHMGCSVLTCGFLIPLLPPGSSCWTHNDVASPG